MQHVLCYEYCALHSDVGIVGLHCLLHDVCTSCVHQLKTRPQDCDTFDTFGLSVGYQSSTTPNTTGRNGLNTHHIALSGFRNCGGILAASRSDLALILTLFIITLD